MSALTAAFGPSAPDTSPISGRDYVLKLRKYLGANLSRLAPPPPPRGKQRDASWLAQSYTVLTLGLDPNSAPLSRNVKVPLTLGFGTPSAPPVHKAAKPILLRLPPDKLLYLLLRWQSLPQSLPHVGKTDVPVPEGVSVAARGAISVRERADGDVDSVRSWVGSIRSVSAAPAERGWGWWGKPQEVDEDKVLIELYSIFNTLPGLLIHPPFATDKPVAELLDAGGYTSLGGVDVRVPLDVLRNLQILELEGYDPRGLLIPVSPLLRSLTVRDVGDGDDWLPELIIDGDVDAEEPAPRFPDLRYLSLHHTSLLAFPALPLTSLTHLDLSHNLLNAIPEALSTLHNLVSLNLSNNLITSVRNASLTLGNIHVLNLASNRLDCLVGLDRVLGLKRVDVRNNILLEAGEVGRLAVLPQIDAVWAAENPFTRGENIEWRAEVAASFVIEGRDVVVDDAALTWNEQRKLEAILASKGRGWRPNLKVETAAATKAAAPAKPPSPVIPAPPSPTRPRDLIPTPASRVITPANTTPSSPAKIIASKKKARRRVVNLDAATAAPSPAAPVSAPEPTPTPAPAPDEPANNGNVVKVKSKSKKKALKDKPEDLNGDKWSHGVAA
ncbi:Nischarin [Vanrija pseudolonga]|uniref:Nischarin n=1 Tax=Vanrija pseudolonga TaxID=143232 RepID=A0AAF0Y9T1_9TREE|nr:Nischarin [Vanrija pseudolonga]